MNSTNKTNKKFATHSESCKDPRTCSSRPTHFHHTATDTYQVTQCQMSALRLFLSRGGTGASTRSSGNQGSSMMGSPLQAFIGAVSAPEATFESARSASQTSTTAAGGTTTSTSAPETKTSDEPKPETSDAYEEPKKA